MNPADRALCTLTADLLRTDGVLARWSLALSCIACLTLALAHARLPTLAWLILLATALIALPERYLALRVRLDALLFARLAGGTLDTPEHIDHAFARLHLRPAASQPRALADRAVGARRLMLRHGALVAAQTLAFLAAMVLELKH
ncbi:MAG: hypothetical protein LBQ32_02855 [Burkholderiaceae bacterium]|jgi:hypothetical protein|nr:hypothetical protein [Burkholderiaceae bacterium]